jgi:hypothetical protein
MLIAHWRKVLLCFCLFAGLAALGTGLARVAGWSARHGQQAEDCATLGLRDKARFMHDLGSLSLENAISRHDDEAREPARRFRELSPEEREALITFLKTL